MMNRSYLTVWRKGAGGEAGGVGWKDAEGLDS